MNYRLEAWTSGDADDDEREVLIESITLSLREDCLMWVWDRLVQGYAVRMYPER